MNDGDSGGAFSIDLLVAMGLLFAVMVPAVLASYNSMSWQFSENSGAGLQPLAEHIGDMLVESPGSPPDWYTTPDIARGTTIIGLSDGSPCILSSEKVASLCFFNATELGRRLALDDAENAYGFRIEVVSDDGAISVAAGNMPGQGTLNVARSVRLSVIRQPDGETHSGKVIVLLWREHTGTRAADF